MGEVFRLSLFTADLQCELEVQRSTLDSILGDKEERSTVIKRVVEFT